MLSFIKNIFKKIIRIFKKNKYKYIDIPHMQHWRTMNTNYNLQEYVREYKTAEGKSE